MYLVNIIKPDNTVEGTVQVVQEVYHLHGRTLRTQRRKADDIAEINGDTFELLRLHHLSGHQLTSDLPLKFRSYYNRARAQKLSKKQQRFRYLGSTW